MAVLISNWTVSGCPWTLCLPIPPLIPGLPGYRPCPLTICWLPGGPCLFQLACHLSCQLCCRRLAGQVEKCGFLCSLYCWWLLLLLLQLLRVGPHDSRCQSHWRSSLASGCSVCPQDLCHHNVCIFLDVTASMGNGNAWVFLPTCTSWAVRKSWCGKD